jgi:hypothetical protein
MFQIQRYPFGKWTNRDLPIQIQWLKGEGERGSPWGVGREVLAALEFNGGVAPVIFGDDKAYDGV